MGNSPIANLYDLTANLRHEPLLLDDFMWQKSIASLEIGFENIYSQMIL